MRVGRVALYEHSVSPCVSELGHSFLGFVLAREVMDRDFLDAFSCELHGDPTSNATRAARDECGLERYLHSADLLKQLVAVGFASVPLAPNNGLTETFSP